MRLTSINLIVLGVFLSLITACGRETSSTADTKMLDSAEVSSQAAESEHDDASEATTLKAQLADQQAQYTKMAPSVMEVIDKAIADLTASGILDQAVKAGDKAPDFSLPDALGNMVNLYEELAKGPVILTWYRGSWCPFCNIQLHDYQKVLGDIHAMDAQLFAVSPELPDSSLSWKEKNELEFVVLSDLGNDIARQYGIVYKIPDSIAASYRKGGRIDLAKFNDDDSLELPLAVTYVIGTDGMVEYAFLDTDWRKRAETSEILDVVTRLAENSE
jgi:peroxiredoxin